MLQIIKDNYNTQAVKVAIPKWDKGIQTLMTNVNVYHQRFLDFVVHEAEGVDFFVNLLSLPVDALHTLTMSGMDLYMEVDTLLKGRYLNHYDHIKAGRTFEGYWTKGENSGVELVTQMSHANPLLDLPLNSGYDSWKGKFTPFKLLATDKAILPINMMDLKLNYGKYYVGCTLFGLDTTLLQVKWIKCLQANKDADMRDFIKTEVYYPLLKSVEEVWLLHILHEMVLGPDADFIKHAIDQTSESEVVTTRQFIHGIECILNVISDMSWYQISMNRFLRTPLSSDGRSVLDILNDRLTKCAIPKRMQYKGMLVLASSPITTLFIALLKVLNDLNVETKLLNRVETGLNNTNRTRGTKHIRHKKTKVYVDMLIKDYLLEIKNMKAQV